MTQEFETNHDINIQNVSRKCYTRWSLLQNQRYIQFLTNYKQDMRSQYNRRVTKVFKRLSQTLGTRDHNQCKSHHQQMLKMYGNLRNIIYYLGRRCFEQAEKADMCYNSRTEKQNDINMGQSLIFDSIRFKAESSEGTQYNEYNQEQSQSLFKVLDF